MSIKVKAVERNVSFDKSKEKWAYVMQEAFAGRSYAPSLRDTLYLRVGKFSHYSIINRIYPPNSTREGKGCDFSFE